MFSFDGEDEELLCVSVAAFINAIPNHTVAGEGGAASLDGCHKYKLPRLLAMLGSADPSRMATQDAASFKGVQLLTQWLALPTTETMVHLMFSNARRAMPASLQHTASAPNLSAAPLAPTNLRSRWSVSGGTPRRPPTIVQSPTSSSAQATPRKRRMSEPTLPTLAFGTPSPSQLGSGEVLDDAAAKLASPRSSNRPIRSPGSKNEQAAAELVHSPLSYFGTQPDVSSRFVQVPSGDGGVQAFFEHAAGAAGVLGPAELLQLGVERLDLPRAVARLVAKRAQEHQRILDEEAVASANAGCDIAPGQDENARPQGACSSRASPTAACPTAAAPVDGDRTERPVSFAAYYAAYGRHRPEETDRIRLFRLVKRPGSPWVLPADLTELVWAVSETHVGLEFLRDSDEFLKSYVQTTSLRILWALAGAGTQRITLQSWRHSSLVEVLFQLDEEADINLARDYFSYNHFYVIWCIFWELDEDEDALLQKADLLRYGSYGLSSRTVDRIWNMRHETDKEGMQYPDFVFFLLAEEDKQATPALQYWFHVLDLDGDGHLDANDMRYFYDELQTRLTAMDEEIVTFEEIVNEFMDFVKPAVCGRISLRELKRCGIGFNLVSALTNVRKYVAWEGLSCEKAAGRASNLRDTRDWDLFADSEYRRLVETEDEANTDGGADDGGTTA